MTMLSKFVNATFSGIAKIMNFPMFLKWEPTKDERLVEPDTSLTAVFPHRIDDTDRDDAPVLFVRPLTSGSAFNATPIGAFRKDFTFGFPGNVVTGWLYNEINILCTSTGYGNPVGGADRYIITELCWSHKGSGAAGTVAVYFNGTPVIVTSIPLDASPASGTERGILATLTTGVQTMDSLGIFVIGFGSGLVEPIIRLTVAPVVMES